MALDNVRIAVLDANDNILGFMDNAAPDALHYHDDELHEYLSGSAYTYEFTCSSRHNDSQNLVVGNKLSFAYHEKGYYLNIVQVERDEFTTTVTAYGMLLELLNEQVGAYSAESAMSFEEYIDAFGFASGIITIGTNEVSNKSITNEWTGTTTILSRLYSLATVFSAEIEFVTELADDYTIEQLTMNVYKEHDEDNDVQGMGIDRTNEIILRYGIDVEGITKKSDITELYTAIRPTGTDGLTVADLDEYEYDDDGAVEYQSPEGDDTIYAVQARDLYPSNAMEGINDKYICKAWEYDTDNVNTLYGQALAQLKKYCVPQVEYEVDGYFDTGIGDTVRIDDQEFNPALYLTARVTEQVRSFTDPTKNKTTFSNFRELESEIDDSLIAQMNALIEASKTYTCVITTDNGIVFKNNEGTTTLTAIVLDGVTNIASDFTITWYKDGETLATGESIIVSATDISGKSVYRFEATDDNGIVRGFYEVTVSNTSDGVGLADMVAQFGVSDSCETGADEYSDDYIVVDETEYLWAKYTAVLTDGSTINTTAYCLTDGSTRLIVNSISAKVAEIDEAYISYAEIDELVAASASIGDLTAQVATIEDAYISAATVNTLLADYATVEYLNANYTTTVNLIAGYASIDYLNTYYTTTVDLAAKYATIDTLKADYLTATEIETNYLSANEIAAKYLATDFANISQLTVDTEAVWTLLANIGIIANLTTDNGYFTGELNAVTISASNLTSGTIDAAEIDVVNLNCANLTVGTINGTQIAAGTIDTTNLSSDITDSITNAQETADGKNTAYYATSAPSGSDYSAGDMWFDTDDGYALYYWNGSAWIPAEFGSNALSDDVNGDIAEALEQAGLATETLSNLSVGGRNYLLNTLTLEAKNLTTGASTAYVYSTDENEYGIWTVTGTGVYLQLNMATAIDASDDSLAGQALVISADIKCDDIVENPSHYQFCFAVYGYNEGSTSWARKYYKGFGFGDKTYCNTSDYVDDEWFRIECKFTGLSLANMTQSTATTYDHYIYTIQLFSNSNNTTGTISIRKPKLELGTIATDWTPAPEDMENTIESVVSIVNGKTTSYYATAEPSGSDFTEGDIWFDTDNDNAMYYWNGSAWVLVLFGSDALSDDVNKDIAEALEQAGLATETLSNLSVGGRNLVLNSTGNLGDTSNWSGVTYYADGYNNHSALGVYRSGITSSTRYFGAQVIDDRIADMLAGDALTISLWYYVDSSVTVTGNQTEFLLRKYDADGGFVSRLIATISSDSVVYDTWQYLELNTTLPTDANEGKCQFLLAVSYDAFIKFSCLKIEKGTVATDWTPAPEDTDSAIESVVSIANGKTTSYYTTSAPSDSDYTTNDIWFDTDDGNAMYYWNGSAWTAAEFGTDAIAASAITAAKIAASAITAGKIASGAVTTDKLAANAVTAAKIAAGTITANEIASATITGDNLVSGTITATQIASSAITAAKIASGAITTDKLAANAVTAAKIAASTITATQIASGTITGDNIASSTITAGNLVAGTITANEISSGAITTACLAANAVTAAKIASGTITATQIASETITGDNLVAGTITATQIASSAITTDKIAANAITTAKIAASAITATQIASGAVTATKIDVDNLSAIAADVGTLSAGILQSTNYVAGTSGLKINLDEGTIDCASLVSTATSGLAQEVYCYVTGTSGTTGIVRLCTITVTGTYANQSITLHVTQRRYDASDIILRLVGSSAASSAISYLANTGGGTFYAVQETETTCSIWALKSEAYDDISVTSYSCGTYMRNRISIEWGTYTGYGLVSSVSGLAELDSSYFTATKLIGYNATATYVTQTKIEQLVDSITLSATGALGSTASIVLSVDGTETTSEIDLRSGARSAFVNDTTAVTISAGTVTFSSNTFAVSSTYFSVTAAGYMTCTSGKIGGWTIGSAALYNGTSSMTSTTVGTYIGTAGIRQYASSSAYVNIKDGVLTSCGAEIFGNIYLYGGLYLPKADVDESGNESDYVKVAYTETLSDATWLHLISTYTQNFETAYLTVDTSASFAAVTINSTLSVSSTTTLKSTLTVQGITTTYAILPALTTTYNIGSSTYRYNYVYAKYLNISATCTLTGTATTSGIQPSENDTYDIGTSTYKYKKGYFSTSVYVGSTSLNTDSLELYGSSPYIDFHFESSTDDYTQRLISLSSSGNITAYPGVSAASDARLKDCIVDLSDEYIDLFDNLTLRQYRLIKGNDLRVGVIAQEVMDAEAELGITESVIVSGTGGILDNGDIDYYAVDYNAILILACAKIKQLEAQIAKLQASA